jgi:hypothetical protein
MRIPLPTLLLLGINIALAAAVGARLLHGSEKQSLLNAQPISSTGAPLQVDVPLLQSDLESIQAKAVFYTSRNFYVAPPPTLALRAPPDFRVTGSMAIPNKPLTVQLTHNQSGARASVGVGSDLEGWSVIKVSPQNITVQLDGRTIEIGAGAAAGANGMTLVRGGAAATNIPTPASGSGMVRVLSGEGRSNAAPPTQSAPPPASDPPRIYRPPSG